MPSAADVMPTPPKHGIGDAILSIAASRSLQALGDACERGLHRFIASGAIGLYFLDDHKPCLFYSKQAPRGFIEEYGDTSYRNDPILEHVVDTGRPIDGAELLGASGWLACGNFKLLKRWGFTNCMAGPLHVEDRIVGVVYTATGGMAETYPQEARNGMELLCRAGSLALTHMIETGRLSNLPIASTGKNTFQALGRPGRQLSENEMIRQLPLRSREVALLLCDGLSNKEIARSLGISPYTVKDHIDRLCKRHEAHNRTELVQRILRAH